MLSETSPWSVFSYGPEDSVFFAPVPSGRLMLMVQDEGLVCQSFYMPVLSQSQINNTTKLSLEHWTLTSLFVVMKNFVYYTYS